MITKAQLIEYQWVLMGIAFLVSYYFYIKLINKKDQSTLQQEYNKLLNADEHKVKSQFD